MKIQTKTRIKKADNSFNLEISKELVKKEGLDDTLENFFGKGKGKIIDAQKMKDESRKIWNMD